MPQYQPSSNIPKAILWSHTWHQPTMQQQTNVQVILYLVALVDISSKHIVELHISTGLHQLGVVHWWDECVRWDKGMRKAWGQMGSILTSNFPAASVPETQYRCYEWQSFQAAMHLSISQLSVIGRFWFLGILWNIRGIWEKCCGCKMYLFVNVGYLIFRHFYCLMGHMSTEVNSL